MTFAVRLNICYSSRCFMKSMTGHGRGNSQLGGVRSVVECFSVNRRSAEIVFLASREYSIFEPRVREIVLDRLARGRVTISLGVTTESGKHSLINTERATAYAAELRELQKVLGLSGELSIETILAGPGVRADSSAFAEHIWPSVEQALHAALDDLLAMREKEGENLQLILEKTMTMLARVGNGIRCHAERLTERHRKNLYAHLEEAGLTCKNNDPRIATEIALFAERCDITEELDRLDSHCDQFGEKLLSKNPVGRTLEFIIQEMSREWNTIGSKANDVAISRFVVEAKTSLDRLREQIANIE